MASRSGSARCVGKYRCIRLLTDAITGQERTGELCQSVRV